MIHPLQDNMPQHHVIEESSTPIMDAPMDIDEVLVEIAAGNLKNERSERIERNERNLPMPLAKRLEHKLNTEIGFAWWNKYVAAAFWSNLSLPLNLTITLLTALTTAQTTTDNLLPRDSYVALSILALVISVLNTFFRPHAQMMENIKVMSKWTEFGNKFESIYYSEGASPKARLKEYQNLQNEINMYENSESPENRNFLTDLIHVMVRASWLKKRDRWLDTTIDYTNEDDTNTVV